MFPITLAKAFSRAISMTALLLTILWSCAPTPKSSQEHESASAQNSSISPPIPEADIPAIELTIEDPTKNNVLTLPSGGELRVPANCFVHENGQLVTAPITLRYREFHNASDIIATGIPMKAVTPDGGHDWLQTAGMFELRGQSEAQSIRFANDKSVEVLFLSEVDGAYDTWLLNESTGLWESLGETNTPKGKVTQPEAVQKEIEILRRATASPPQAPALTPPAEQLVFSDLDLSQTPELKGIPNLAFAYSGDDSKLDPRNNKWITKPGIWVKKELKPTDKPGVYQLTLVGDEYFSIPVKKAIQVEDKEAAMAAYRAELANYQANLGRLAGLSPKSSQAQFQREMQIRGFGFFNYDIFVKQDDFMPLAADFDLGDLHPIEKKETTIYHITSNGKAVLTLTPDKWDSFKFNPAMDNGLVAILPDKRIAVFTASSFKAALPEIKKAGGRKFVFPMEIQRESPNNFDDLKILLDKAAS